MSNRELVHKVCSRVITQEYLTRWFNADHMFNTEYETSILHSNYFVTSSVFVPSSGEPLPRAYQVRFIDRKNRRIQTLETHLPTLEAALAVVEQHYEQIQKRSTL